MIFIMLMFIIEKVSDQFSGLSLLISYAEILFLSVFKKADIKEKHIINSPVNKKITKKTDSCER